MKHRFYIFTILLPLLAISWVAVGAYRDIKARDERTAALKNHRDYIVLRELARIEKDIATRQPKTLGEAIQLIGPLGWCGKFKGMPQYPTATWSFRSTIPVGDSRVWPTANETIWGEAARASVESCEHTARVIWITPGTPQEVRLP